MKDSHQLNRNTVKPLRELLLSRECPLPSRNEREGELLHEEQATSGQMTDEQALHLSSETSPLLALPTPTITPSNVSLSLPPSFDASIAGSGLEGDEPIATALPCPALDVADADAAMSSSASAPASRGTSHPPRPAPSPAAVPIPPRPALAAAPTTSRLARTRHLAAHRTRATRRGFRRRAASATRRRFPSIPPIMLAMGGMLVIAMLIPVLIVGMSHNPPASFPSSTEGATPLPPPSSPPSPLALEAGEEPQVSVYLTKLGQIETMPLEDYVTGVVAAEMPADFAFESLKAQATAARTYIVQRLLTNDKSGVPVEGADVTDTVAHQAYLSKETLEKEWKSQGKATQLANVKRAVLESRNIVMTYKGKPITATFFSTSNGFTENSEDYWQVAIPYLRSVSSPWDIEIAPYYKDTIKLSKEEFLNQMGLSKLAAATFKNKQGEYSLDSLIHILSTTQGNRIKELSIGGVTFSGREVREKLGLRSSQFSWVDSGKDIVITTYGNGHGVGMSQWGANGMAQEGYTATQILEHYYTGIEFQQVTKLLAKK